MKRKNIAGAALGAATLALAILSACADTISAGVDTPPPQKPTFADPDAAAPIPPPEAGLCNAYECPAPYATCPGTSGLCTTNLSNDVAHCGACDNESRAGTRSAATAACSSIKTTRTAERALTSAPIRRPTPGRRCGLAVRRSCRRAPASIA